MLLRPGSNRRYKQEVRAFAGHRFTRNSVIFEIFKFVRHPVHHLLLMSFGLKDHSTGIGLRYVKKHLESGYEEKYDLIINDSEDFYAVALSVQLN